MAHYVKDIRQLGKEYSYLILEELDSQEAQRKVDLRKSVYDALGISHRDIQHLLDSEGGHESLNLLVDWDGVDELATKFFHQSESELEAISGFYQRTSPGKYAPLELLEQFCQKLYELSNTQRSQLESYLNIQGQVTAYITKSDGFVEGQILEEMPDDAVPANLIKIVYSGPEKFFVDYVRDWEGAFNTKLCCPRDYITIRKAPVGAPKSIGYTQVFHAPSDKYKEGEVFDDLPEDLVLL